MKNYSSNRAQKGSVGYRTPSRWKANRPVETRRLKAQIQYKVSHTKNMRTDY